MTHKKRLPAPKHYPIERKGRTYVSTIEGSRGTEDAIPAVVLLRDVFGYAENETDAKKIVKDRAVLRNGEPLTDIRQGVGVLDVVELPDAEEAYRVLRDGRDLKFVAVTDEDRVAAKVVDKNAEGDEYVYRLHNGENYRSEKEYSTGNTLVFNSSVKEVVLEEGADVLVIKGKHAGDVAELKEINRRGMNRDTGVISNEHEIETQLENLVAIENLQVGDQ
jgi:small subunit ribosomal protein S4e